jgi:hypothetical protein
MRRSRMIVIGITKGNIISILISGPHHHLE